MLAHKAAASTVRELKNQPFRRYPIDNVTYIDYLCIKIPYAMNFSKSLIAASSKPLILGILQQGPNYGYEIIQQIKAISGGKLEWADGMLYPVLHRLEKEGLVQSQWHQSDNGRHRKYYSITEAGKAAIHQEKEHWLAIHDVLLKLWSLNSNTSNG